MLVLRRITVCPRGVWERWKNMVIVTVCHSTCYTLEVRLWTFTWMQIVPFETRSSQKTQCHYDWYMFRLYPAGPSTSAMVHNKSSTGTNKDSRTAASHVLRQKITGQQKSKKQTSSMLSFFIQIKHVFEDHPSDPQKKPLTFHLYWLFKKNPYI